MIASTVRRPLFGSNLAPRDTGGKYAVVHCCTGLLVTSGWKYDTAVAIAGENNAVQDEYGARGEGLCSRGGACLGWVVFKDPVAGGYEP